MKMLNMVTSQITNTACVRVQPAAPGPNQTHDHVFRVPASPSLSRPVPDEAPDLVANAVVDERNAHLPEERPQVIDGTVPVRQCHNSPRVPEGAVDEHPPRLGHYGP